ncbi:hypothetical protein A0128_02680 [Leptospira tipperaryensis]|uniref:DUF1640 domain-containing protein n=1 Tax=Leptospira tipperaryensis TaxID=2564040 RepID=A0A1D7UTH9_9LEPT|nr:hypothetical protein [Leptospira tipperaryensis]AOP32871.1 hypothetical protein A0128_02680 [Leptospira tipperaryensis]
MSALVQKVPKRLGEVLGPDGTVEFVDFLNHSFGNSQTNTIEIVSDRFDRRLKEETNQIRMEMSGLRSDFSDLRADFADLRADFADHQSEIKSEIAEIHKAISTQTKWVFGAIIGLIGAFSIILKF